MATLEREIAPSSAKKLISATEPGAENLPFGYTLHDLVSLYPPLTSDETLKSLELIRNGRKAAALLETNQNPLTTEETERLKEAQRDGLKAQQRLTLHFLQLVLGKAARYRSSELDLWDLFQEGTIGLMKATEKFDPQKGTSFPSYAVGGILNTIKRARENQEGLIRIPIHSHAKLRSIREVQNKLEQELGRLPSLEELSATTGIRVTTIASLSRNSQRSISLEEPVGDGKRVVGDFIPDPKAVSPEAATLKKLEKEAIRRALVCLEPREKEVICLRFGFTTGESLTLREIGERLSFSGEWVRLTEANSLKKLRENLLEER